MNLLLIYILGACISGFIFTLFTYSKSFYEYMCDTINEAKNKMKNSDEYSLQDNIIIDNICNDSIIRSLNILIVLFSWAGIIVVFMYIFPWILKILKNN